MRAANPHHRQHHHKHGQDRPNEKAGRRAFKELLAASRLSRGAKTPRRTLAEVEATFRDPHARESAPTQAQHPRGPRPRIFANTTVFKEDVDIAAFSRREGTLYKARQATRRPSLDAHNVSSDTRKARQRPAANTKLAQGQGQTQDSKELDDLLIKWQKLRSAFFAERNERHKKSHMALRDEWGTWLRNRNPALKAQWAAIRDRRMDLRQWFNVLDEDKSGEISTDELVDPLLTVGLCRSRQQVERLVSKIDVDGSGAIGFDEFVNIVCSEEGEDPNSANALVQLYRAVARGELGDSNLDFSMLLSSYRRKVILRALAPESQRIESSKERQQDKRCVDALANEFWSQKYA